MLDRSDAAAHAAGSFERFLREQREALVHFLRAHAHSEEDAQDVAQESLSRLVRYKDTQPAESWKTLLYRIAVNVAHDRSRWDRRRHATEHAPLDEIEFSMPSPDPPHEDMVSRQQELARIGAVIRRLPPRCQEVYLLSRVEGMKNAEIAKHCGISLKAVEAHMTKAMAIVRQALGNRNRETL
ncbi:MAG: sigma-70 family RNA polymerase sigma factor [Rudaea sp.]|uniref:RNA polymerase sigma factor n=1 Tax=Rudaea sp. TaxID=2136325 RepID=UPI0039E24003